MFNGGISWWGFTGRVVTEGVSVAGPSEDGAPVGCGEFAPTKDKDPPSSLTAVESLAVSFSTLSTGRSCTGRSDGIPGGVSDCCAKDEVGIATTTMTDKKKPFISHLPPPAFRVSTHPPSHA